MIRFARLTAVAHRSETDPVRANKPATHRSERLISLADAVLIGSAGPNDQIATADADVLAVAEAESLEAVALPGQG